MGFVPGAARVRQAAHGAARLERGRGTRRTESRGTGKKKGREGEGRRQAGPGCQREEALASAGWAGGCASGAGWGRAGCWAERKKGRWFAGWAAGAW